MISKMINLKSKNSMSEYDIWNESQAFLGII